MTPDIRHKHLIVRAEVASPVTDTKFLDHWIVELISKLGMNLLMGPYSVYSDKDGNRGITGAAIIDTSHIAIHTWDECSPAIVMLDVYTCSEIDPEMVFEHFKVFSPIKTEWKMLDREHSLKDITNVFY